MTHELEDTLESNPVQSFDDVELGIPGRRRGVSFMVPYRPHRPWPVLADDGAARRAVCGGYLRDKKEVDGLRAPSRATARKAAHGAASIA